MPNDHVPAEPVAPEALLALATTLAERAAGLLVDGLTQARTEVLTKSTGTDMVTEMDRRSEALVVAGILEARPGDGVVGEEGTDRPGTSGVTWIVDPLDGTTNYLYGHPGFAVSIAASAGGRVVAGAVADPLHGDLFAASLGGGATRNGRPIRCRDEAVLGQALVGTGFSYEPERRRRQAEVLTQVLPAVRDIRRMGAAAVDLCAVACGRLDAFYEKGLQPWDYAAGALIASEAGATVGDLEGQPTSSSFTLAAAPALFAPLGQLLRRAGAGSA